MCKPEWLPLKKGISYSWCSATDVNLRIDLACIQLRLLKKMYLFLLAYARLLCWTHSPFLSTTFIRSASKKALFIPFSHPPAPSNKLSWWMGFVPILFYGKRFSLDDSFRSICHFAVVSIVWLKGKSHCSLLTGFISLFFFFFFDGIIGANSVHE